MTYSNYVTRYAKYPAPYPAFAGFLPSRVGQSSGIIATNEPQSPLVIMAGKLGQYISLAKNLSALTLDTTTGVTTVSGVQDLGIVPHNFTSGAKNTQPVFTQSDPNLGSPTFTTDGVNDQIVSTYNMPAPGVAPSAMFGVINLRTAPANGFIYSDNSAVGVGALFSSGPSSTLKTQYASGLVVSPCPINAWVMFYAEFTNNALDVIKVGSNPAVAGNAGTGTVQNGRAIGSSGGVAFSNVSIAEIGIYLGARGTFPLKDYQSWVNFNWGGAVQQ